MEEPLAENPGVVVYRTPALVDAERLGNEAARQRFAEDARDARQAAKEALAREERHDRVLAAQKAHDEAVAAKKAEAERVALAKAIAKEVAAVKAEAKPEVKPEPKRERIVVSRSDKPKAAPIVFEATAYVAMCDTGCTGITATGIDVRNTIYTQGHRVIAVDPSVVPLGSLVRVNTPSGAFSAIAADTGGHIKGHRVDILMGSLSKARAFGRQNVSIQILRNGAK